MADRDENPPQLGRRHLDATGPREVVFCHQCQHEWLRALDGSLVCPVCEGEVTEIVSPESDPRNFDDTRPPHPRTPDHGLHTHNPWADDGNFPDPEEADVEEHILHGPGGASFTRTETRFGNMGQDRNTRPGFAPTDPDHVLRDFQNMVGGMLGPGFRAGPSGRSGPDTLFNQGSTAGGFRFTNTAPGNGPQFTGTRFTWTMDNGRFTGTRQTTGPQIIQAEDFSGFLGGLFGPAMARGNAGANMPPGLLGLFSMINPQNARSGDTVYTQEALDTIISQLMEQHPTSNAPGPATPEDIASLPKKKLDHEMLGPEGRGECSVCMDDVHIGDEVVVLPCSHWFHEVCASAWLSEHNTCPICRKGINDPPTPASDGRSPGPTATPAPQEEPHPHRSGTSTNTSRQFGFGGMTGSPRDNSGPSSSRNAARLDAIRNTSRQAAASGPTPQSWSFSGMPAEDSPRTTPSNDPTTSMPGSFQRRASAMSETQRDNRRRNTGGSDHSRRSSQSGGHGNGNGTFSWLRDRFGSNRRTD